MTHLTTLQKLRQTLELHEPADDKEGVDRGEMLHRAQTLPSPFDRKGPDAHFTGSALVVDSTGTRVCLLLHRKLNRWLQPGGHAEAADEGELATTALREAREELGLTVRLHPTAPAPLDLDIHRIPGRADEPGHWHLDVRYLLVAEDPDALRADAEETSGAQWLTFDEALARADEAPLRRLLMKGRRAAPAGTSSAGPTRG